MSRHIVHIHIPAFPIAVARVKQPALRGRPVAVVPARSERSVLLSVSPEAREEGIFKGMPLGKAKKLCPDLSVLSPDPELAEKAWQILAEAAAHYTPLWEPLRPGHIYLDLTGTERLWGRAKDTGYRLMREIQSRLRLSTTVGVAGNKMVSSIASRLMWTEGLLDVDHGREAAFMAPLKVGLLPGIGRVGERILLEELDITRVWQLAVLDMASLKLMFGRQALVIHQRVRGIDPTPVYPAPAKPVVSEAVTLPHDDNDDRSLLGVLYGLVEKCAHRLRQRALFPRKAGLLIRYSDQMESRRQLQLPFLSYWDANLYGSLEKLFYKACNRRVRVRCMKVWFWDFSSGSQLCLFSERSPEVEKNSLVTRTIDRIRERYGEDAIGYGRTYGARHKAHGTGHKPSKDHGSGLKVLDGFPPLRPAPRALSSK
jgi:DNA polymerase-4